MVHGGDIYSNEIEYDFSINLNPVRCPNIVIDELKRSIGDISHYPDIKQRNAREILARLEKVMPCNVMAGNGASELIMAAVRMIKPKSAVIIQPSFFGYNHVINSIENCRIIHYELKEENGFAVTEDFVQFLKATSPELVIVANPNNPTGCLVSNGLVKEIIYVCESMNTAVLIDECFLGMTEETESVGPMVMQYDNLYVVKAFTKLFSIPGVRVGYILSSKKNIENIKKYLPEWNLSVFSGNAAGACAKVLIESDLFRNETLETIRKERRYLTDSLEKLVDKVYKSDTSFLLLRSDKPLYELLLAEKILIRDCSNFEGLGKGFYRIAVKDHDSNKVLIDTLRKVVENGN